MLISIDKLFVIVFPSQVAVGRFIVHRRIRLKETGTFGRDEPTYERVVDRFLVNGYLTGHVEYDRISLLLVPEQSLAYFVHRLWRPAAQVIENNAEHIVQRT